MLLFCRVASLAAASSLWIASAASGQAPRNDQPIGLLLVAGDIAKCNPDSGQDEATAKVVKQAVDEAGSRNIPVRVLALGDLAYDDGTRANFECFDSSWGAFKSIMLPVPGNHEYANAPDRDAAPYFDYFSDNPLVAQNGAKTGYYAVNFPDADNGPWRLVGLNAYVQASGGLSNELNWLKADLESHSTPCVLAFWHPFVLSSGHHGHDNGDSAEPVRGRLMLPAFRTLLEHGATVVLSGHDHDYEQFSPHDDEGKRSEDGIRSFVVGTGGGRLYTSERTTRWESSEFYDEKHYGVLSISLFADRYSWTFLPIEGADAPSLPVKEDKCQDRHE